MMEIRWAGPGDAAVLASIGVRAWQSALAGWGEAFSGHGAVMRERYLAFATAYWDRILIAQEDRTAVGWASRQLLDQEISDLWVDPAHQGRGIGGRLLAAVEEGVVGAGFDRIDLQTHAGNQTAIRFFERSGYRPVSLSVKYSPVLQQDVPTVFMRKDVGGQAWPQIEGDDHCDRTDSA